MYNDQKPTLVVRLEGGVVRDIVANTPVDVVIADYDVEGCDLDTLPQLPSLVDADSVETAYAPVDCSQSPKVYVDPLMTASIARAARGDDSGGRHAL